MYEVIFKGKEAVPAIICYGNNESIMSTEDVISLADRQIIEIHFSTSIVFSSLLEIFQDENALSEILIKFNDEQQDVHLDYVIPVSLSIKTFEGEQRTIMKLAKLNQTDIQLRKTVKEITRHPSVLSLHEYKKYKISQSKDKLEEYLSENPLVSKCHDGVYKKYTATTDKQNMFTRKFMAHFIKVQAGMINDVMKWNEAGEECVSWTDDECIAFMYDMDNYITPLVAAQQAYEKAILLCNSKEELDKMDIDYYSGEINNELVDVN